MDSILSFINEYRIILGAIVLTLTAGILAKKFWREIAFFMLRVKLNIPLVGKISRLSKQPGLDESGWFHSEKDLCSEFRPYFTEVDKSPKFYDNCKNYLRKVHELGRKKMGVFAWALICIMVFIEAMGFSYVLAGFTIPGASESLQQQGAIGIALLISGLLVALTHNTGHELQKNGLIKKVRTFRSASKDSAPLLPNHEVSLEHDYVDDHDPGWKAILSRVDANATVQRSYKITICTAIFVILVAIGATYVRGQVLQAEAMAEHQASSGPSAQASAADPYANDPYAAEVPQELVASQQEADKAVSDQIFESNIKGGWATFIVLAVIFVFLQILGVLIGFKTGFSGKESTIAYDFSHRFKNREEFEAYHERKRNEIAQIAQRNLAKLQARMEKKLRDTTADTDVEDALTNNNQRTFLAYARKSATEHGRYDVETSFERRERDELIEQAHSKTSDNRVTAKASDGAAEEGHGLSEETISEWMQKLGWDRQRTIDLLVKQREKKKSEQRKEVSEEEALRMLEGSGD